MILLSTSLASAAFSWAGVAFDVGAGLPISDDARVFLNITNSNPPSRDSLERERYEFAQATCKGYSVNLNSSGGRVAEDSSCGGNARKLLEDVRASGAEERDSVGSEVRTAGDHGPIGSWWVVDSEAQVAGC